MNEPKEEKVREKLKLSEFYNGDGRAGFVNATRLFLMPFVFIALLGIPIPGILGNYIRAISNFAALSFFVYCGFFTLVENPEKRMRKLARGAKRSAWLFLIMLVSYLALNIAYLAYIGGLRFLISPEFLRVRTVFEFLFLNVWQFPVGNSIWFIQSLTYAYLIFLFMEKFNLFKPYIYLPLLGVLLVFMLLSGEFAGVVGISYFGYSYIPGGFLTKALPFMLIGMLLRKYVDQLSRIPRFVYIITFVAGILLSVGELLLLATFNKLVYTGNTIGYAVMAISFCCFAIVGPEAKQSFFASHGRSYSRRMYALCQPVSLLVWFIFNLVDPQMLSAMMQLNSIICFVVCLGLAFLIGLIKLNITLKREYLRG